MNKRIGYNETPRLGTRTGTNTSTNTGTQEFNRPCPQNYQAPSSSLWSPPGPHYRLLSRTPTDAPSPLPARRAARRLRHGAASVPGRAALAPDAAPLSRACRPQPATMLSTLAASALGLAVHLSPAASARGRQRDSVPRGLLPGVQYAPMRGARVCMPTLERSDDGIRASLSGRNDSE